MPTNPYDTPDRYACARCGVMVDELDTYFDDAHWPHCRDCKEEIGEAWRPLEAYDA